jgi:peptidoglycan-associated lipoprotein
LKTTVLVSLILSTVFLLSACHKKGTAALPGSDLQTAEDKQPDNVVKDHSNGSLEDISSASTQMKPVFFDFNKYEIRADQEEVIRDDARILKSNVDLKLTVQGHCDERGTEEYNLALGERRANALREYLVSLGVEKGRINVVSFGEDKPFEFGHNEEAWKMNRRAQPLAVR